MLFIYLLHKLVCILYIRLILQIIISTQYCISRAPPPHTHTLFLYVTLSPSLTAALGPLASFRGGVLVPLCLLHPRITPI